MKFFSLPFCIIPLFLFAGCLVSPVERSGGSGSVTVPHSNISAIAAAARNVFAANGYTQSIDGLPQFLAFDKPAGTFGEAMFGSFNQTTTFRVRLTITPIPQTTDFRISPTVARISNAGVTGFESDTRMMGIWGKQFRPLMQAIREQAGNAGPE